MNINRVANRDCHLYVDKHVEFVGSNLFSKILEGKDKHIYVVYSFGTHWPLYAYDFTAYRWFGNKTEYDGRTTNKHARQARPSAFIHPDNWLDIGNMKQLAALGYNGFIAQRLGVDREAA